MLNGVYGDSERLDHRRLGERDLLRKPVENAGRKTDVLGERAVTAVLVAGDSDHFAPVAEVDGACETERTGAAAHGRIECHVVAALPFRDLRSRGDNHARR